MGMMPLMARQARLPVASWNFIAFQETILRPNTSIPEYFRRWQKTHQEDTHFSSDEWKQK